jgi:hypothetical protein
MRRWPPLLVGFLHGCALCSVRRPGGRTGVRPAFAGHGASERLKDPRGRRARAGPLHQVRPWGGVRMPRSPRPTPAFPGGDGDWPERVSRSSLQGRSSIRRRWENICRGAVFLNASVVKQTVTHAPNPRNPLGLQRITAPRERCAVTAAVFVFDTTHHALWAEEVAREAAIPAEVIPAPPAARARCNLALETLPEDAHRLADALTGDGRASRGDAEGAENGGERRPASSGPLPENERRLPSRTLPRVGVHAEPRRGASRISVIPAHAPARPSRPTLVASPPVQALARDGSPDRVFLAPARHGRPPRQRGLSAPDSPPCTGECQKDAIG